MRKKSRRKIAWIIATGLGLLSLLFSSVAIQRFQMPYNTEGNYFDEETQIVYHQQSVIVYVILTVVLLGVTIFVLYVGSNKKRL